MWLHEKANTKRNLALFLAIFTFIIYWNAIDNEYAIDDGLVAEGNTVVEKGIVSIPEIFTSHFSRLGTENHGYRPVVLTTFAIEKEFFGKMKNFQTPWEKEKRNKITQANVSHFINVLLYALTCVILFFLLIKVFSNYSLWYSFLIALLFLGHPLHTEPVNNIKSRDELLMLLGLILALYYFLKYADEKKLSYLGLGLVFALFSILSKVTGIVLLPMLVVLLYFKRYPVRNSLIVLGSMVLVIILTRVLVRSLVDTDSVRNLQHFENPLFLEDGFIGRIPVALYCSWFYLKMLIFPKDLSYYYGYNQIPMADWSFYEVWLALVLYVSLAIYGVIQFIKRYSIGLGLAMWLGIMLGAVNLLLPLVGIVADRFTYVFSIGFCIVLADILVRIFKINMSSNIVKLQLKRVFVVCLILIIFIYSGRTIARNMDWEDGLTLYSNDIGHLENSTHAHSTLAIFLQDAIRIGYLKESLAEHRKDAIHHFKRAIEIDSSRHYLYAQTASAIIVNSNNYKDALPYLEQAQRYEADNANVSFNLCIAYEQTQNVEAALNQYKNTITKFPNLAEVYEPFIQFSIKTKIVDQSSDFLVKRAEKVEQPKHLYVTLANLTFRGKKDKETSLMYFEKAYESDTTDQVICEHIANLYKSIGDTSKYNYYIKQCR